MLEKYNVQELDEQKEKIKYELLSGITPSSQPCAYLLAGQPGAGKSTMAKIFVCEHQKISPSSRATITARIIHISLSCKHSTVMMLSSIHSSSRGR